MPKGVFFSMIPRGPLPSSTPTFSPGSPLRLRRSPSTGARTIRPWWRVTGRLRESVTWWPRAAKTCSPGW